METNNVTEILYEVDEKEKNIWNKYEVILVRWIRVIW